MKLEVQAHEIKNEDNMKNEDNLRKLLDEAAPCPFCGGRPSHIETDEFHGEPHVCCEPCMTGMIPLEVWNKRPQESKLRETLEVIYLKCAMA